MGREKSTPSKLSSEQADSTATAVDADAERSALRLGRLRELIDSHFAGSHTAFGSVAGVGATHVKRWLEGKSSPGSVKLIRISDATKVSIDWLLGCDVPADRNVRAPAGDFARRLHAELLAVAPQFAPVSLLGNPADLSDRAGWSQVVVQDVVTGWWEQQRALQSRDYGNAVRSLAQRLEVESSDVSDERIGTFMRQQARDLTRRYASLLNGEGTWRDQFELEPGLLCSDIPYVTAMAHKNRDETTVAYLQAPFLALGGARGVGVAWRTEAVDRGETLDHALFIEPQRLQVTHVADANFLVELTIAERFAPLPSGA